MTNCCEILVISINGWMDIAVIRPTIGGVLHDCYIFCAFLLRLELRGHSSATFSLGRVGDINPVDLNNLKKPISPKKLI